MANPCKRVRELEDRHVHGHSHRSKVADSEDTADDIAPQVIKDEDFPDGLAVGREYSGGRIAQTAVGVGVVRFLCLDIVVEVKYPLDRGCQAGVSARAKMHC